MAVIQQKDIKLLWGRSGNRCAMCKIELTQDKNADSSSFTLGEQAHIVGEKEKASRGQSLLSEKQRNFYHNLILLCPNHHTEIDSNEQDWPVEKLHQIKSEHELWVSETLSATTDLVKASKQVAVAAIIDSAVKLCRLDRWDIWTSWTLAPSPQWDASMPDEIYEFRQKVIGAIWPEEYDELHRAAETLSIALNLAAQTFLKHCERHGETLYPYKFYKRNGWNENYDAEAKEYDAWAKQCREYLIDSTKAANWFADVVRKDINPMFFAEHGRLLVIEGDILGHQTKLYQFTQDEKNSLPQSKFA
ncbi:TPA: HNH endonuclease [Aeromonas veronii]